jgi:hypothetical protein
MINALKSRNQEFKKLNEEASSLFEQIKTVNKVLNKKTHKQGTEDFYRTRNYKKMMQQPKDVTPLFEDTFKKVLGISLVLKLMIDPMPLLLTDEEIYLRIISPMAGLIEKYYISKYNLEAILAEFKQTTYYKEFYDEFLKLKKRSRAFIEFESFGNVDYSQIERIICDFEDLTDTRKIAITVCKEMKNVLSISFGNGLYNFVTTNTGFSRNAYIGNHEWFPKKGKFFNPYYNKLANDYYQSLFIVEQKPFYVNTSIALNESQISYIEHTINEYKKFI